jgi:CheY-like chemotaxis protein
VTSILVIDDDADMADACATVLRLEGDAVRIARNGREGLACLEQELPDVIVCDVEMPLMDGPALASQAYLRDRGAELIPIVLVSGAANLAVIAQRVGTPYFLAKPFSGEQLLELLARANTERHAPRPRIEGGP